MAHRPSTGQAYQRQPYAPSHSPAQGLPQFAPPAAAANVPPGTLPPGTVVRIGEYEVRVERFLSEGGFAHVYLATSSSPIPAGSPSATTKHVLKRIAVPDKKGVEEVGKEVEVMKLVRNHPRIVNMIEASVSELPGGVDGSKGYEIYILMEWCAGGGIIDMMNTRLQNRLTETEILKIFSDTVEAVAHMHYQNPPLIHRDLKVENILLTPPQTYKLCDFGSTTVPMPREKVPTAVEAIQKMELEINKTTTLQYRAPELVDVWGRKGYDEKIDIWALGVLLYKLCYYTTPFEEHGPLAILSAQYKIPPYPAYSNSIKGLIGGMLQESASRRPNIFQVHEQVCRLRGVAVRLENKYASSSSSSQPIAPLNKSSADPAYSNILSSAPVSTGPVGPSLAETVSPMRRGRPTKSTVAASSAAADAVDTRMVKTGSEAPTGGRQWESMGSGAGGSASAWPTGKSAPTTGNGFGDNFSSSAGASSSPAQASFGDSFAPAQSSNAPATAFSPPPGGAMFSDLLPPSASASPKPGPMVPKSTVGKISSVGQDDWKSRPSSAGPQPSSSLPNPKAPLDDETAAFESNYPSLDDFPGSSFSVNVNDTLSPRPSASFQPTAPTDSPKEVDSFLPSSSPAPAQLTGESGPALPRRPVAEADAFPSPRPRRAPSKPELVSRSSQTSPHLLDGWRPPIGTSTRLNKSTVPSDPPSARSPDPVALPGLTNGPSKVKQPSFDLLGDDPDNDDAFAPKPFTPRPSSSGGHLPSSTLPPLTQPTAVATLPPLTQPLPASASGSIASKRMSFMSGGSLSGIDSGLTSAREKFRPVRPAEPLATVTGSPKSTALPLPAPFNNPPTSADADDDAEKRYPSIDLLDSTPTPPAPSLRTRTETPVSEERSWQPVVEKEDLAESSDDEPEDFAPRRPANANGRESRPLPQPPARDNDVQVDESRAQTLPPINRLSSMSSSEGGGEIDLGPALSSIRKFAPTQVAQPQPQQDQVERLHSSPEPASRPSFSSSGRSPSSGPPIVAPKPQSSKRQAAITNLVSRYETLSTAEPNLEMDVTCASATSTSSKRPPPPVKPASLRRDSLGSQTSASGGKTSSSRPTGSNRPHWASKAASPRDFQQRFPDTDGLDKHLTGESAQPRTPPSASSTHSFVAADRPPPFKPVGPPGTPKRNSTLGAGGERPLPKVPASEQAQEEEEEKFAGVRNMKSRWENMGRGNGPSSGPGRAVGGRKEWGVV